MKHLIISLTILSMILTGGLSFAEIPHYMQFQGKATDADDTPLDGSHNITFRIYDAESGGNLKWTEAHTDVDIEDGVFSVLLGGTTPLDIAFDEPYWISVDINSTGEMARQRISSVGYAYHASTADTVINGAGKVKASSTDSTEGYLDEKVDGTSVKVSSDQLEVGNLLGAWESKDNNTVYQAATDGFVMAYCNSTQHRIIGYTDGNNPPTTIRIRDHAAGPSVDNASITMPVRKGDYWKVENAQVVYWISLGS